MRRFVATLRLYFPAIVLFVVVIVVWEVGVRFFGVKGFILPAPSAIWAALVDNWTTGYQILDAAQVTLYEALGGLVDRGDRGPPRRLRRLPLAGVA